MIAKLWI